jgi:uncharacterized membrane protein YdjX (TVP38/TMEM64 family)
MAEKTTTLKDKIHKLMDFSDWTWKTWIFVIAFVFVIIFAIVLIVVNIFNPDFLYGLIINYFVIPVLNIGEFGWFLFLAFMLIQSIAMPIPSEVVLLSSGMIWSFYGGFVLGFIGSVLSGTMAYFIARKGGTPIVEKFIGRENIETLDIYIKKYGGLAIFIARAFPFMAYDPISYISGMIKVEKKVYFIATTVGSIIRAAFYAFLGNSIVGSYNLVELAENPTELEAVIANGAAQFNSVIMVVFGLMAVFAVVYQFVLMPFLKRKRDQMVKAEELTKNASN